MKHEYENVVTALLSCLGVGSFLQFLSLLFPVLGTFVLVFLALYVVVSMLFVVKSAYHERFTDRYDLTAPTTLGNGLLVIRSRGDKCAAFFAFVLPLKEVLLESARRTLTTLVKVLPQGSVVSAELTDRSERFVSFYVKLEKGEVIQRAQQLVESVLSGLKAIFGEDDVRLLFDHELPRHLALGVPGRIQRAGRFSRHTVFLQTDVSNYWLSAVAMTHIPADLLQAFDCESGRNSETRRLVFAVKSQEQRRVALSSRLILTTMNDRPHSDKLPLRSSLTDVRQMLASDIVRKLGDIMTRSVFTQERNLVSFEKGADELLSFLALGCTRRSDTEARGAKNQAAHQMGAKQREWREVLFATAEELGLAYEADILVSTEGFPLRVDARVGSTLFKVVPDSGANQERLQWLVSQLAVAMASEGASCMALLLGNPSDAFTLTKLLMKMPARNQIRSLTSFVQLRALLLERSSGPETAIDVPANGLQKIL